MTTPPGRLRPRRRRPAHTAPPAAATVGGGAEPGTGSGQPDGALGCKLRR
ncbi:hypothetical protein [Yinghuangia seranimata]|nr:hypothetical protein [Yinghuangia seranimata]MDI2126433.1 hypothetical protein [Yinghuangia seranimata]